MRISGSLFLKQRRCCWDFTHGVARKSLRCDNVVLHNGRSLIPGFLLAFRMVCYDVSRCAKEYDSLLRICMLAYAYDVRHVMLCGKYRVWCYMYTSPLSCLLYLSLACVLALYIPSMYWLSTALPSVKGSEWGTASFVMPWRCRVVAVRGVPHVEMNVT